MIGHLAIGAEGVPQGRVKGLRMQPGDLVFVLVGEELEIALGDRFCEAFGA